MQIAPEIFKYSASTVWIFHYHAAVMVTMTPFKTLMDSTFVSIVMDSLSPIILHCPALSGSTVSNIYIMKQNRISERARLWGRRCTLHKLERWAVSATYAYTWNRTQNSNRNSDQSNLIQFNHNQCRHFCTFNLKYLQSMILRFNLDLGNICVQCAASF